MAVCSQGTVGQSLDMQTGVHKALPRCDEQGLGREVEGAESPPTRVASKGSVNSNVKPGLLGSWEVLLTD